MNKGRKLSTVAGFPTLEDTQERLAVDTPTAKRLLERLQTPWAPRPTKSSRRCRRWMLSIGSGILKMPERHWVRQPQPEITHWRP